MDTEADKKARREARELKRRVGELRRLERDGAIRWGRLNPHDVIDTAIWRCDQCKGEDYFSSIPTTLVKIGLCQECLMRSKDPARRGIKRMLEANGGKCLDNAKEIREVTRDLLDLFCLLSG